MLDLLAHILMWAGAAIVVVAVVVAWAIALIAVNDMAVEPLLDDAKKHPFIHKMQTKIEEYRNARS